MTSSSLSPQVVVDSSSADDLRSCCWSFLARRLRPPPIVGDHFHSKKMDQQKWEAKVSARLQKATADEIWPLFQDFFGLGKWFPGLSTCHGIHGNNAQLGCIRYCAGFSLSGKTDCAGEENPAPAVPTNWSKERLIAMDPAARTLSYEMLDGSIGFKNYVSTVKIVPGGDEGCEIEWGFTVDPVEGWRLEDLVKIYDLGLQSMAKKMEDSIAIS
nr:lachrymatory-factor synthase [Ipomoea batatas]